MSSIFARGNTVLFQGDSITDCGRNRDEHSSMGEGYASIAARLLSEAQPELDLQFLNRGNSGNRAVDLAGRWQADCLDLKPNVVSIMIGINDTWRRYDSGDPTSIESYRKDYHSILTQTAETGAKLILIEPFVLPHPPDRLAWREDLDPKLEAVHEFAKEFNALLVPMDKVFAQACDRKEASLWAEDGVHPTGPGHELIAETWVDCVLGE